MNRTYILMALIMFLLGAGLVFLPQPRNNRELSPEQILLSLNEPFRYISTDQAARRIIAGDPALLLIDVRDSAAFAAFSLPGAVNIPFSHILDEENQALLAEGSKDYVFYSNGDILSEKAWLLCSRLRHRKLYILQGGLNHWVETILRPPVPAATSDAAVFDQYDFRMAARMYFTGEGELPGMRKAGESAAQRSVRPIARPSGKRKHEGC
ncbi:MAG TPA: rhodanese-like domain-containing protein [Bacteroidales bacterium]|nr:rhodanese-like domain-containing protein [Bacteroidales bacterium]HSA42077.1 rhodanese-like domain-containing protein [Bacteroidales bacterium]